VAGADDRDQLVAQLFVAHRRAVVIAGAQQQREDVVSLAVVGLDLGAANRYLLVDELVERLAGADEAGPRPERPEVTTQEGEGGERADAPGEGVDQPPGAVEALRVVDAEDGLEDHRQGDPLSVASKREGLTDRPALHLAQGDLADQLAVSLHSLAVKGRQQQLALAHVGLVVERQHRVRPQRHLQHRCVRLTGVELVGAAGEDRFDQFRVGHVDDLAEVGEGESEDVAEAAPVGSEEAEGVACVAQGRDRRGRFRAGRKGRDAGHLQLVNRRLLHPPRTIEQKLARQPITLPASLPGGAWGRY